MASGDSRSRSASLTTVTNSPLMAMQLIPNELLAYAFGATTRHPKEDVRSTILGFYPAGEIQAAKKLLWETFAAKLPQMQSRNDTKLRPSYEADLDDLLRAVYCLDEKRGEGDAEFVVRDIYNLPPLIQDCPSSRLEVIENAVKEMCQIMHQQHFPPLNADAPPQCPLSDTQPKTLATYSEVALAQSSSADKCDDDGYTLVKYKRRENPSPPNAVQTLAATQQRDPAASAAANAPATRPRQQQRRMPNVGTRKHEQFKAGPQRTELFVFRVENSVSEDVIKDYLKEEKVKVNAMAKVSKDDAATQSFHITVECDDPEVLLTDPSFWPDRICCRRFYTKPRPRRSNAANGNAQSWTNKK
jgi:hypothetical protein